MIAERDDERFNRFVVEHLQHVIAPRPVTENADAAIENRPQPARIEMIAIEMREADRCHVADAYAGSVHAFVGRARTESRIDEQHTRASADYRAVSGGTGSADS